MTAARTNTHRPAATEPAASAPTGTAVRAACGRERTGFRGRARPSRGRARPACRALQAFCPPLSASRLFGAPAAQHDRRIFRNRADAGEDQAKIVAHAARHQHRRRGQLAAEQAVVHHNHRQLVGAHAAGQGQRIDRHRNHRLHGDEIERIQTVLGKAERQIDEIGDEKKRRPLHEHEQEAFCQQRLMRLHMRGGLLIFGERHREVDRLFLGVPYQPQRPQQLDERAADALGDARAEHRQQAGGQHQPVDGGAEDQQRGENTAAALPHQTGIADQARNGKQDEHGFVQHGVNQRREHAFGHRHAVLAHMINDHRLPAGRRRGDGRIVEIDAAVAGAAQQSRRIAEGTQKQPHDAAVAQQIDRHHQRGNQ